MNFTTFRESINNLIRTDKPESTSRALALAIGLNAIGWIWYALIIGKIDTLMVCLVQVFAFIITLLGVKQYDERKKQEIGGANASGDSPTTPQV